ncbi:hypothetical protein [uncultured Paraglaciecola sp.]|uniref:hypothetical protein n=1 Tax=uncultured Paraglaciecola sp. TaxID=1765024 RepID=UPI0026248221|nr:hypothetical protein [uncultured Paraglaciecola sp.]
MNTKTLQHFSVALCVSLAALLAGCAKHNHAPNLTSITLDPIAEQYVKLGLELGQYDKDYVDAYLGPDQWKTHAKHNLRSKQQLAADIKLLFESLKNFEVNGKQQKLRHKALYRNVRAMDVRARMVNGETFSFAEEARLIYDVDIPSYDYRTFDQALAEIDKLVPGKGDLAQRVATFRKQFEVANDKVSEVVDQAISECSKRSSQYISLPANERFELQYVTDKNWSGYNWYQGDNKSLMQINQDFPMQIDRAITLGCHEGYPGHHVWNVLIENNLLNKNGWIEYSIFPLFSPYALIAEGSANFGVELSFPDKQKIVYESDVLFPLAGLDPAKTEALDKLTKLTGQLSHSRNAITQQYLNGEMSRKQAIEMTRKYSLVSKERAEQSVRFSEQYRAYVLNYNLGKEIVRNYVNKQSKNEAQKWQAFERLLTELSTASDMTE